MTAAFAFLHDPSASYSIAALYPYNLDPCSVEYLMTDLLFRCPSVDVRGVKCHASVCACAATFGEVSRVDDENAFYDLVTDQRKLTRKREITGELTFAKGGNKLGIIITSGRTLTISPSLK